MDLTRDRWHRLSSADKAGLARSILRGLPAGFEFDGLARFTMNGLAGEVAVFRSRSGRFAFVPGGEVALGRDPSRPWVPTPEERASFAASAEEYEIDADPATFVATVATPRRTVTLPPLLVETSAGEIGWEAVDPDSPAARDVLRELRHYPSVRISDDAGSVRASREGGVLRVERCPSRTHGEVIDFLRKSGGFRLPTSDEWEYLCGAGAATLFRWGDHAPADRYPTDDESPDADHRRENALGLRIAPDPYQMELVAEIGTRRGGDGGSAICGGAGFFLGWLPLATAWFDDSSCRFDDDESVTDSYHVGRRVMDLS